MSAETLRRAAALMRERAGEATPGPWEVYLRGLTQLPAIWSEFAGRAVARPYVDGPTPHADAAYIASMAPRVGLAFADLLDHAADDHDEAVCPAMDAALLVARAYLGVSA